MVLVVMRWLPSGAGFAGGAPSLYQRVPASARAGHPDGQQTRKMAVSRPGDILTHKSTFISKVHTLTFQPVTIAESGAVSMSVENNASLQDDISFLRKLAGEGRGRPAPMAALVTGFGLLFGIASLYEWWALRAYVKSILETNGLYSVGTVWSAVFVLFGLLLLLCLVQAFLQRGKSPAVNRVAAAGWAAAFLGFVAICASAILQGRMVNNYFALNLMPSFFLVLWGFGWGVSAAATGRNWLYAVAAGSLLAAPLWAVTSFFSYDGFLVAGLCCLLLAFAPGVILMRRG
jgi:hypothetical protein